MRHGAVHYVVRDPGDRMPLRVGDQPPPNLGGVAEGWRPVAGPANALLLEVALDFERDPYGLVDDADGEEDDGRKQEGD